MTLAAQVDKLKRRFQLEHVVLLGDRGMIPSAHHRGDHGGRPGWITALRAPAIKALLANGALHCRCSTSATWPPSRHPSSRRASGGVPYPDLAAQRCRKRAELLAATEGDLPAFRQPSHAVAIHCVAPPRSRWPSAR